jgi:cysteine desulfurase
MNVYLDHAATTPLNPEVLETMLPWMSSTAYNANATHQFGRQANVVVEQAREYIASVLNVEPAEIIFNSGGTEGNNAIIHGVAAATGKKHFISSVIEHHAVLQPIETSSHGCADTHTFLKPNHLGVVSVNDVINAIRKEETALVSLMHVNNEIGAINPLSELSSACHEHGVLFHSDCVQSIGKMPVNLKELGVDFATVSAHKFYGPKGVGLMYVSHGSDWKPWQLGGSQERNRRGGTLNVAGIIGMAKALQIANQQMEDDMSHYKNLRSQLLSKLKPVFGHKMIINGGENEGMPHILNLSFVNEGNQALDGEMMLFNLDIEGIAVSNGSACTSGAVQGSHVLVGIGHSNEVAKSSIRMSFGRANTPDEINYVGDKIIECVGRMIKQPTS